MKKFYLLHDDNIENNAGGNGAPPSEKTPPANSNEPSNSKTDEEGGDGFDELGYAKATAKEPPKDSKETKTSDKKTETPPAGDGKKEDEVSVSGYGGKKSSVEEKKPEGEKPPPQSEKLTVTDETTKEVHELKADGLDPKEAAKLKSFIEKNKLTKEAAQDLIDLKKSELKAQADAVVTAQKEHEKAVQKIRTEWRSELESDPTFGGTNFDKNVHNVEKLLSEHMPSTKNELTKRGSMLPPYVMRDLAKLADTIYSSDTFVQGGATVPEKTSDKDDADDPLAFYNQKSNP